MRNISSSYDITPLVSERKLKTKVKELDENIDKTLAKRVKKYNLEIEKHQIIHISIKHIH